MFKKIIVLMYVTSMIAFLEASDQAVNEITFGLGGDVMLGRSVGETILKKGIIYPWGSLLTNLRNATFNIVNLESTLTKSTKKNPQPKAFNFQSDPSNVDALLKAHIQVVNLANNHSLDFDAQGLQETINTLDKNNIYHVGAGSTLQEAQKPALFKKNGIRFAVLGFTDNEPLWAATDKKAGNNYVAINQKTSDSLKQLIASTKKDADILIISLHWGPNWEERPKKEFKEFAHTLLDAGADIIHGHSAHILQGIELYKNKLIFYSCGDLLDDYKVEKELRNDETCLFLITANTQGIQKLQVIPAIISNEQVNRAEGTDAKRIIQKVQNLSKELGPLTLDDLGYWQRSS